MGKTKSKAAAKPKTTDEWTVPGEQRRQWDFHTLALNEVRTYPTDMGTGEEFYRVAKDAVRQFRQRTGSRIGVMLKPNGQVAVKLLSKGKKAA